jgi:hypothetical protein
MGEPQPQWSDVMASEQSLTALRELIEASGLFAVVIPGAFSVRTHAAFDEGTQVALFVLAPDGDFERGWVQHASGTGRSDYRDLADWFEALINVHATSKGRNS